MGKKTHNPKTIRLQGTIIALIGIGFLLYWTHPIGLPEEWKELSKQLVISIGIPLCLINMGMICWATGTILQKLDEKK